MRLRTVVMGLGLAGAVWLARCPSATSPRIATFNIERFGADDKRTDGKRLVALIDSLNADVLAVQEIEDGERFARVVASLGGDKRRYALALSRCGGGSGMRVGFVYDRDRVRLEGTAEYPELDPRGEGACSRGERPGFVGRFVSGGQRFALLTVHLAAYADEEFAQKRRSQWRRALQLVDDLQKSGWPAAILGDTNSTGWADDRHGERSFIVDETRRAGLRIATDRLRCTEYYEKQGRLEPSMLDHIVVSRDFPGAAGAVLSGYCAELGCRPVDAAQAPSDYARVSDHCPVSLTH